MLGHIEVSLDAIRHNAQTLARLVAPSRVAFVVKGEAYGHGAVEVARTVAPLAHALCVYGIGEAAALRAAGIDARIIVLGPVAPQRLPDALSLDAAIALWDTGTYFRQLLLVTRAQGKCAHVHVKVNTGLNRLGLEPSELRESMELYRSAPDAVTIDGIFSHLAAAEELDSPYTTMQLERFNSALESVPQTGPENERPLRHIAASAAAMLWPQTRMDLVRCGIALYGLWPSAQTREAIQNGGVDLRPALSYRSELVAIREVEAGSPVGYGAAYHAPRPTRIGVVPLGYADGIPRALSNRGAFIVAGRRCPVIGRVAMNMTMIDLGGGGDATIGDAVTLIGHDGEASVTADDWADWAETINYEIVTRLPAHVPRVFEAV